MCIIITMIGFVLAFNFFQAQNYWASAGSVAVGIFFLVLMIKNINHVKKLKREKEESKK